MPISSFTFDEALQVTALAYAQAVAIPTGGTPTTLLFTALGPPAIVLLQQAVLSTTGTAASGSTQLTVASATSAAVGQLVVGVGIPNGAVVIAINSLVITLSAKTTASLSTTAVSFVTPVTIPTGIAVIPTAQLALAIGSNTFISYISASGGSPSYGGFPGTSFQTVLNIAAGS